MSDLSAAELQVGEETLHYEGGELMVKFKNLMTYEQADSILGVYGCSIERILPTEIWVVVSFDTSRDVENVMEDLESDQSIWGVIPNFHMEMGQVPNDSLFTTQWYLQNSEQSLPLGISGGKPGADISILEAWSIQEGSSAVRIGLLDSGIPLDRRELCDQTGTLVWPDLQDSSRLILGGNYADSSYCLPNDIDAPTGHGTAVAAVLCATKNNSFGIAGVVDNSEILVIRAFSLITAGDFASAVQEAIDS